ncbi:hypothetical protein C1H46_029856 [Malus baccata]|uniref:Uncharacterized protein n=1 Tax=Malus baccata TaxID=106549 RepID=A0A540LDK1_MALBA|nr:hypothetical protein C1H46_029856 [Malus baccata]
MVRLLSLFNRSSDTVSVKMYDKDMGSAFNNEGLYINKDIDDSGDWKMRVFLTCANYKFKISRLRGVIRLVIADDGITLINDEDEAITLYPKYVHHKFYHTSIKNGKWMIKRSE